MLFLGEEELLWVSGRFPKDAKLQSQQSLSMLSFCGDLCQSSAM